MFSSDVYKQRRAGLQQRLGKGLVLLLGNVESPMNYAANTYPFRQDSTFLYYFGVDRAGFAGLIDLDENRHLLVGDDFTIDDIIWMGPQPKVAEFSAQCAADGHITHEMLQARLLEAVSLGRTVHFLPPYRPENKALLTKLLGIQEGRLKQYASQPLIRAVVSQREIKSAAEVAEIELALDISFEMVAQMLHTARPGVGEYDVVGAVDAVLAARKSRYSFPVILSVHGETLHNHEHGNILKSGDLLVCDSGAESPEHYASDITRTLPVGGRFSPRQKEMYEVVLAAQQAGFGKIRPGTPYREAHLAAASAVFRGLKAIGLMKGNESDAVSEGAHALFFPHGLGHMMGLDVHDMEDLGENNIGYDDGQARSGQFGLAYLRMAKAVRPGHVLTVEPGLYFIPELIDLWAAEKKWAQFINFDKLAEYRNFGGIRIEDDVLVTEEGHRILGRPIPKTVDEIQSAMT
jgi:Xaa-Pro aminopeptidase